MLGQMMRIFDNLRIYPTCQSLQAILIEVRYFFDRRLNIQQ
ncbi:hypothetical protein V6Z11_A02G146800 [Gossypium hirsutum]